MNKYKRLLKKNKYQQGTGYLKPLPYTPSMIHADTSREDIGGQVAGTAIGAGMSAMGVPGGQLIGGLAGKFIGNHLLGANKKREQAKQDFSKSQDYINMSNQHSYKDNSNYIADVGLYLEKKRNHTDKKPTIEVEKNELGVDGNSLNIKQDFKNAKPHSKGGKQIKVGRELSEGDAIIPDYMRDAYRKGNKQERAMIVNSLPKDTDTKMFEDGTRSLGEDPFKKKNELLGDITNKNLINTDNVRMDRRYGTPNDPVVTANKFKTPLSKPATTKANTSFLNLPTVNQPSNVNSPLNPNNNVNSIQPVQRIKPGINLASDKDAHRRDVNLPETMSKKPVNIDTNNPLEGTLQERRSNLKPEEGSLQKAFNTNVFNKDKGVSPIGFDKDKLSKGLDYIPTAMNIAKGLSPMEVESKKSYNPALNETEDRRAEQTKQLRDAQAMAMANNRNSGSLQGLQQNNANTLLNTAQQQRGVNEDYYRRREQTNQANTGLLNDAQIRNMQMADQHETRTLQTKANRDNILGQAMTDITKQRQMDRFRKDQTEQFDKHNERENVKTMLSASSDQLKFDKNIQDTMISQMRSNGDTRSEEEIRKLIEDGTIGKKEMAEIMNVNRK